MSQTKRNGSGLVKALVVISILAVVVCLLLPGTYRVRHGVAPHLKCQNHLKQIGLATANYSSAHDDHLPAFVSNFASEMPNRYASIQVALLPFLEEAVLEEAMWNDYLAWAAAGAPTSPDALWDAFATDIAVRVKVFSCPSDPSAPSGVVSGFASAPNPIFTTLGSSNYACNPYLFHVGSVDGNSKYRIDAIPDGSSNTIGWTERIAANTTDQMAWPSSQIPKAATRFPRPSLSGPVLPIYSDANNGVYTMVLPLIGTKPNVASGASPQTCHVGSIQVALMDGSVRGVNATVSQEIWNLLFSPADGQKIDTSR